MLIYRNIKIQTVLWSALLLLPMVKNLRIVYVIPELEKFLQDAKKGNYASLRSSDTIEVDIFKSQGSDMTSYYTSQITNSGTGYIILGSGELSYTQLQGNTSKLLLNKLEKMLRDVKAGK